MNTDPHTDTYSESALRLLVEPRHPAGDLQTREHRPARIVFMRARMTEHRQKPIALIGGDMALELVHRRINTFAVAAHQHAIDLWLHSAREHRRIHQIGEKDCQPTNLTAVSRRGQQILGVRVYAVDCQHLFRQRRPSGPIAAVDRRYRLFEEIINRRDVPRPGIAVPPRVHLIVAHANMVALCATS